MSSTDIALAVRDLSKRYGAVRALDGVTMHVRRGEVLGLLGDNGAGKSTLVGCISGVHQPDEGVIEVDGQPVEIADPAVARELGIETVFQGLALVPMMDVASNLFLNREIRSTRPILRQLRWLDRGAMRRESRAILDRLRISIPDVTQRIDRLSGGQRQAVAVGRAVGWGRHIVLMDEPAAALGVEQSKHVLELIRVLRDSGVAVVLVSHNMQHVVDVCDRAVVLRHGRTVGDVGMHGTTALDLVALITGASQT